MGQTCSEHTSGGFRGGEGMDAMAPQILETAQDMLEVCDKDMF